MNLVHLPINELSSFDENPRTITAMKLLALQSSIVSLGLFKPLLVWQSGEQNMVIGGNQRLRAMGEMWELPPEGIDGTAWQAWKQTMTEGIPGIVYQGDEASAKTVALRDNNADGDWDWESLTHYVTALEGIGGDLSLTGFDEGVVDDLRELAGSVDAGLQRFTSDLEDLESDSESAVVIEEEEEEEELEDPLQKGRKIARFTIGNIRGQITVDDYKRFLTCWQQHADETQSTDIPTIFRSMLDGLEIRADDIARRDMEDGLLSELSKMDLGGDSAVIRQAVKNAIERLSED